MNFSSLKAITIPEGNVKKIQRGDMVLWETPSQSLSGMSVSIKYKSKTTQSGTNTATYSFTVTVSGIPVEYVQSFGVKMYYYATASLIRETVKTVTAELFDPDYTSKVVSTTVTFTGPVNYYPSFAGFLTYTDLDGSTKTLTTNRVSSVNGSATASK